MKAQDQVVGYIALEMELNKDMNEVCEKLDQIRTKINDNIKSELKPNGFLNHKEDVYLDCLKHSHAQLKDLFRLDNQFWKYNAE